MSVVAWCWVPALWAAGQLSLRDAGSCQEVGKVEVHAGHAKVGFALERLAHIIGLVGVSAGELDDGQDEVVGLVKRVQNLVARHGDAPLYLDKAQLAGAGYAAFNVSAELFKLAVGRLKTQASFDGHNDGTGARWADLGINRRRGRTGFRDHRLFHSLDQAHRHHQQATQHHGRKR